MVFPSLVRELFSKSKQETVSDKFLKPKTEQQQKTKRKYISN